MAIGEGVQQTGIRTKHHGTRRLGREIPISPTPHNRDDNSQGLSFVNISRPDDAKDKDTRKAIRHHVMATVGKSRRKPPKSFTFSVRALPTYVETPQISGAPSAEDFDNWPSWRFVPRSLHYYGVFPVDTGTRARQLIQFMHTEGDHVYRPFRYEWFSMAVVDYSAFYQITNHSGTEYSDCVESARYFSTCLNQIAQRLGSKTDSISQGVITTILGFLCHDSCLGKWDRWAIHMDGLENILQLRGGFQILSTNTSMFTSWYDLRAAYGCGEN
ncbi:uncharacterized protein Z518_04741 [Rhinocladiella mackenziei CBS 650.93]|uniref:Uncharacterized protein n=1 Tax=Rhinocladiella mackenziei CBS 650.93 TaxID=1442369 RepID=A0A0D2JCD3_9EURO|nr:uncharacterized protein Z518_04741 [Rhinocladiella mackenziei CBS 650.93]KIX06765.1 hypothetical protein Z518_04741 [Rhinocladiella mackenziei CBS 650.93]